MISLLSEQYLPHTTDTHAIGTFCPFILPVFEPLNQLSRLI